MASSMAGAAASNSSSVINTLHNKSRLGGFPVPRWRNRALDKPCGKIRCSRERSQPRVVRRRWHCMRLCRFFPFPKSTTLVFQSVDVFGLGAELLLHFVYG